MVFMNAFFAPVVPQVVQVIGGILTSTWVQVIFKCPIQLIKYIYVVASLNYLNIDYLIFYSCFDASIQMDH